MQIIRHSARFAVIAAAVLAALAFSSCGETKSQEDLAHVNPAASACASAMAQIQVGDGFLEILCGCTSSATVAGAVVVAPIASAADFTCHVPAGTTVIWQIPSTQLWHQIVSVSIAGGSSFTSGPVIEPGSLAPTNVATFNAPGTYAFVDADNAGLQGEIIVP